MFLSCTTTGREVRIFFIDQGKLQYFLPNETWIDREKPDTSMDADVLFRSYALENEQEAMTIFNFTLRSGDPAILHGNPVVSLALCNGDSEVVHPEGVEVLFTDRGMVRYTSFMSSSDFSAYMNSCEEPVIMLETARGSFKFVSKSGAFYEHIDYFKTVRPEIN